MSAIRRNQDDYHHALSALLPQGIGWPRWFRAVVQKVMLGLAASFARVDGRAADLLERESDPRLTVELLPDWERNFGLPDKCITEPITVGERQRMLVQRMTMEGGASKAFFIKVARELGYEISITERRPFMAGIDRAGDNRKILPDGSFGPYPAHVGPLALRFWWTVHVRRVKLVWFRAGKGQAGVDHHLEIGLATDLECIIRRWRPAQTHVTFNYSGVVPGDPLAGTP